MDKWALYRNHEIAIMFDDATVAANARVTIVEDVLSRSEIASIENSNWDRTKSWFRDKVEYFI